MFGRLLHWYTIYTLLASLAPNGILPGAKFTLRPSLVFSYIGSVTARRQPNLVTWDTGQGKELRNFRFWAMARISTRVV